MSARRSVCRSASTRLSLSIYPLAHIGFPIDVRHSLLSPPLSFVPWCVSGSDAPAEARAEYRRLLRLCRNRMNQLGVRQTDLDGEEENVNFGLIAATDGLQTLALAVQATTEAATSDGVAGTPRSTSGAGAGGTHPRSWRPPPSTVLLAVGCPSTGCPPPSSSPRLRRGPTSSWSCAMTWIRCSAGRAPRRRCTACSARAALTPATTSCPRLSARLRARRGSGTAAQPSAAQMCAAPR